MKIKSIVSSYYLFVNRLRLAISIERTDRFFKIILFNRYKKFILIIRIFLTFIGLFSAFIVFQSPMIVFTFGLFIYLLSTGFEKIIFSYRTMYVHSFPDFELKPENWLACIFGYAETLDKSKKLPLIGIGLSDYEYSKSIHKLLLQWTFGETNDIDKNLSISVVVINSSSYVFFIYPNIRKRNAEEFYQQAESEHKKLSLTDTHHRLSILQVMGKKFDLSKNSFFHRFRKIYVSGEPCYFQLYLYHDNKQPELIEDLNTITIHDFSIKDALQLTRQDIEYDMFRIIN